MNKSDNAVLLKRDNEFDDELSLLDLIGFIRRNARTLLAGVFVGSAIGLGAAFSIAPQWEANALIRMGQLGTGTPVESGLRAVDRVKFRSFGNDVLKRLGIPSSETDSSAKLYRKSLIIKVEKSELLSLNVRARSQEAALKSANAVVDELKSAHSRIAQPTIDRWHQELEEISRGMEREIRESDQLKKESSSGAGTVDGKNLYQAVLAGNILLARESTIRSLRDRKYILEEQLSPERTFPTSVLGRVEVSEQPVFPKKTLFVIAGLVIGLLLGVMWSMLKSNSAGAK